MPRNSNIQSRILYPTKIIFNILVTVDKSNCLKSKFVKLVVPYNIPDISLKLPVFNPVIFISVKLEHP